MHVAEQSPRICRDGTLRWYAGDTFVITFDFNLQNQDGEPVQIEATDEAEVNFKNYRNEVIAKFTSIGSSSVEVNMDSEITKRFKEGIYVIDARFNGDFITTLMRNNKAVVEWY